MNGDESLFGSLEMAGAHAFCQVGGATCAPGHDIPHPIGDPDEDEELPGEDDDDEDDDDDDEEEPLQV